MPEDIMKRVPNPIVEMATAEKEEPWMSPGAEFERRYPDGPHFTHALHWHPGDMPPTNTEWDGVYLVILHFTTVDGRMIPAYEFATYSADGWETANVTGGQVAAWAMLTDPEKIGRRLNQQRKSSERLRAYRETKSDNVDGFGAGDSVKSDNVDAFADDAGAV